STLPLNDTIPISLTAQSVPLKASDQAFFAQLKSDGTITNYTAVISANGSLSAAASSFQSFSVEAVDPNNYPVVSQPTFVTPSNGSVSTLLTHNQVIVTQNFLDNFHKKVGDSLNLYNKNQTGSGK